MSRGDRPVQRGDPGPAIVRASSGAPAAHLAARVAEIEAGACEADLDAMVAASEADLRRLYAAREIEPEEL